MPQPLLRALVASVVLAATLALPRPSQAQQSAADLTLDQLLARCPSLIDATGPAVSEAIPTSAGLDAYFDYSPAASGCQVSLQADVDVALSTISARLTEDPGWSSMGTHLWRGPRHLLIIDRFEEDSVSGASVRLVLIDSPMGAAALARHRRAGRSLIDVARKAIFEICPILDFEKPDAARALIEAEPELFRGGAAADPLEGRINLQKFASVCTVQVQGIKAEEAVTGVLDEAETRGYVIDPEGRFHSPDFVLFARKVSDSDPPFFEVHLFGRDVYEAAISP